MSSPSSPAAATLPFGRSPRKASFAAQKLIKEIAKDEENDRKAPASRRKTRKSSARKRRHDNDVSGEVVTPDLGRWNSPFSAPTVYSRNSTTVFSKWTSESSQQADNVGQIRRQIPPQVSQKENGGDMHAQSEERLGIQPPDTGRGVPARAFESEDTRATQKLRPAVQAGSTVSQTEPETFIHAKSNKVVEEDRSSQQLVREALESYGQSSRGSQVARRVQEESNENRTAQGITPSVDAPARKVPTSKGVVDAPARKVPGVAGMNSKGREPARGADERVQASGVDSENRLGRKSSSPIQESVGGKVVNANEEGNVGFQSLQPGNGGTQSKSCVIDVNMKDNVDVAQQPGKKLVEEAQPWEEIGPTNTETPGNGGTESVIDLEVSQQPVAGNRPPKKRAEEQVKRNAGTPENGPGGRMEVASIPEEATAGVNLLAEVATSLERARPRRSSRERAQVTESTSPMEAERPTPDPSPTVAAADSQDPGRSRRSRSRQAPGGTEDSAMEGVSEEENKDPSGASAAADTQDLPGRKRRSRSRQAPSVTEESEMEGVVEEEDEDPSAAAPKRRVRKVLPPPPDMDFYEEETAHLYYNPPLPERGEDIPGAVAPEDLPPLPPPPPLPALPDTGKCLWSFDPQTRVLLADFRQMNGSVEVIREDEEFLLRMMERDDITVISDGLAGDLTEKLWNLEYIAQAVGDEYYHKFRKFEAAEGMPKDKSAGSKAGKMAAQPSAGLGGAEVPGESEEHGAAAEQSEEAKTNESDNGEQSEEWTTVHREKDKCHSIKVADFVHYLCMRREAMDKKESGEALTADETIFKFVDHLGKDHEIDVTKVVLYMIDYDLVKLLPRLHEDLMQNFKLFGCLPGGTHCMMNAVNSGGRPFMGPNLYVTPPASFTQFHQDGHGTVDSGHLCLSGYNEVIMLRRLPERHKIHALALLKGDEDLEYTGLYELPHGDGLGEKPAWPTTDAIEACRKMNYCPSVFILGPGQLVHINKGRLHAFRKLSPYPLLPTDCHAKLRSGVLESLGDKGKKEIVCISVAWDWMFRGVTSEGVNREVVAVLECAAINRIVGLQSLAIPELALLQMARTMAPRDDLAAVKFVAGQSVLSGFRGDGGSSRFVPPDKEILRGILPALRYVVDQHIEATNRASHASENRASGAEDDDSGAPRLSVAKRPNTAENPQSFTMDPYGEGDFFCKLCSKELSNIYMHCDGCEIILNKDFNICVDCHLEGRYKVKVQMHPLNDARHSTINHTGDLNLYRSSRCPCKKGPVCKRCNYCAGCSCKCHQSFTLHHRFFSAEVENSLVSRVEAAVGSDQISYSEEIADRLCAGSILEVPETSKRPARTAAITPCGDRETSARKKRPPSSSVSTRKRQMSDGKGNPRRRRTPKSNELQAGQSGGTGKRTPKHRRTPESYEQAGSKRTPKRRRPTFESGESQTAAVNGMSNANGRVTAVPSRHVGLGFPFSQQELKAAQSWRLDGVPKSKHDLSDEALKYTVPKDSSETASCGHGGAIRSLTAADIKKFVCEAKKLPNRTSDRMRELLPPDCRDMTNDEIRHLFRNFCDAEVTGKAYKNGRKNNSWYHVIGFTPREVEIFLHANCMNASVGECRALLPYRDLKSYRKLLAAFYGASVFEQSRDVEEIKAYRVHLLKTVGSLFDLEQQDE